MSEKPRILCLHGGGVSARIFELQMRYFIKSMARDFRLVFVDGPWSSEMHEDLRPVYSDMGTCYRWASWSQQHPALDDALAVREVERSLTQAMESDQGNGEWVGLLGFSQGAKLAFSILLENQLRLQRDPWAAPFAGAHWRFGVIMAGRAPPFSLSPLTRKSKHYSSLTNLSQGRQHDKALPLDRSPTKLYTPTLHVHGLKDGGLELHRDLLHKFASPAHSRLIEWDGAHRIPIRSADVKLVTDAILEIANVCFKICYAQRI